MKAMLRSLSVAVVGAVVIAVLAVAPASANGSLKADIKKDNVEGELHGFVMFNTRPDEISVHVSIKSASPANDGSRLFTVYVYQGCENQHYDFFYKAFEINGAGNGNFHVVVNRVTGADCVAVTTGTTPGNRYHTDHVPI